MKLRLEIDDSSEEEIVIRAKRLTPEISRLTEGVQDLLERGNALSVRSGGAERFINANEIVFAEVMASKTYVHTANDVFVSPLRLHELELILPRSFAKASKSCIVNTAKICSLLRSPTGVGEAGFYGTVKKTYISRMYYKIVRDKTEETRSIK